MKQAQIISYGLEGPLAGRLQQMAQEHGLWLRELQHVSACRNLLRREGPAVLLLMLGRDVIAELSLAEEVGRASPETAVVVVGDADNPALAALAWDLGARCVLQPPQPVELLPEIVLRLLPGEQQ
jgi:DNA-binding NarL/FixJ family response regulator